MFRAALTALILTAAPFVVMAAMHMLTPHFYGDVIHVRSTKHHGTIKLWDVATCQERDALRGHAGEVRSVAFSPDGETLASGSNDTTIKLWYLGTDREPGRQKGPALVELVHPQVK